QLVEINKEIKVKTPITLLAISIAMSSFAFANNKAEMKNNPCSPLFEACEANGYSKDGLAGKDIWDDCKKPLLDGITIANVTVNQADIAKCKSFKQDKK